MSAPTAVSPAAGPLTLIRAAAFSRSESGVVALALAVVGLHVLDDNYLQPQPGTSVGDHLASGLVPLAILTLVAALYPRLRAWLRASSAMTLGAIGITFGVPGAYYLLHGSASGDHYSGLLAIVAGAVLLLSGPVTLWKARRTGGSRRRRYLRRTLATVTAVVAALLSLTFIVFPVGYAYVYTHTGRTATTPDLGVHYESVQVTTGDGLELAASYVPSKNRAAVILFPGSDALRRGADADPSRLRRSAARPARAGQKRGRHARRPRPALCRETSRVPANARSSQTVPVSYPRRIRISPSQATPNAHLQGFCAIPLTDRTVDPSLPWRFRGVTRVHARSRATQFFLQIGLIRRRTMRRETSRVSFLMCPFCVRAELFS